MRQLLQSLVTLLAFGYIFYKFNILVSNPFTDIRLEAFSFSLALVLFICQIPVSAYRWKTILHIMDSKMSFSRILSISWLAQFWMQLTPAGLAGDAYKVFKLDLSTGDAILSVLLDKLLALLGAVIISILLLIKIIQAYIGNEYFKLLPSYIFFFISSIILYVIVWFIWLRISSNLKRYFLSSTRLVKLIRSWLVAKQTINSLYKKLSVRHGVTLLFSSIISQINLVLAVYFLARGFTIEAHLADFFVAIPLVMIFSNLPISFGGWGVREASMVFALAPFNISQAHAFLLGISVGAISLIFAILAGLSITLKSVSRVLRFL